MLTKSLINWFNIVHGGLFLHWKVMAMQKRWTLFPTLKLHEQSGLLQSRKLWLNLWLVSNFNPFGLWILYASLHFGLIKFMILFLKIKYDLYHFMIMSKLFHSFTVYGKNEFLKSSFLTLKFREENEKRLT